MHSFLGNGGLDRIFLHGLVSEPHATALEGFRTRRRSLVDLRLRIRTGGLAWAGDDGGSGKRLWKVREGANEYFSRSDFSSMIASAIFGLLYAFSSNGRSVEGSIHMWCISDGP